MSWINPPTGEGLEYSVSVEVENFYRREQPALWCSNHVTQPAVDWIDEDAEMRSPHVWYFKTPANALLFQSTGSSV